MGKEVVRNGTTGDKSQSKQSLKGNFVYMQTHTHTQRERKNDRNKAEERDADTQTCTERTQTDRLTDTHTDTRRLTNTRRQEIHRFPWACTCLSMYLPVICP